MDRERMEHEENEREVRDLFRATRPEVTPERLARLAERAQAIPGEVAAARREERRSAVGPLAVVAVVAVAAATVALFVVAWPGPVSREGTEAVGMRMEVREESAPGMVATAGEEEEWEEEWEESLYLPSSALPWSPVSLESDSPYSLSLLHGPLPGTDSDEWEEIADSVLSERGLTAGDHSGI